jgi:hypothetical protein
MHIISDQQTNLVHIIFNKHKIKSSLSGEITSTHGGASWDYLIQIDKPFNELVYIQMRGILEVYFYFLNQLLYLSLGSTCNF